MMRHRLVFGLFLLALAAPALAEDVAPPAQPDNAAVAAQSATPASQHVLFAAKDLKWMDGPEGLPKGAKFTVLNGNPGAPGLFTIRAMLPAGYKVPAHFHGTDENVTVIAGEMSIGMGDVLDMAKGDALGAGGFTAMSAGMHHYAWTKKGATIQIHGMGPFSITYLNPSDDPRNAKEAAK
jgi:uncharacterized RmlC-like cupin family protein